MTEQELRRYEFIEERIGILVESGMSEANAVALASALWERLDAMMDKGVDNTSAM